MKRSKALEYLQDEFGVIATECGLDLLADGDTLTKNPIDQALRAMHVAEEDISTWDVTSPKLIEDYQALLDYYFLKRLTRQLATKSDVKQGDRMRYRSQVFGQVKGLLGDAEEEIKKRGYGPTAFTFGYLELDFLEADDGGDY